MRELGYKNDREACAALGIKRSTYYHYRAGTRAIPATVVKLIGLLRAARNKATPPPCDAPAA